HSDPSRRGLFRHDLAVVGEVPFGSRAQRSTFEEALCDLLPDAPAPFAHAFYVLAPLRHPRTLRLILAGSPGRFRPFPGLRVGGLLDGEEARPRARRRGFPGAMGFPPTLLFATGRWWLYAQALKS